MKCVKLLTLRIRICIRVLLCYHQHETSTLCTWGPVAPSQGISWMQCVPSVEDLSLIFALTKTKRASGCVSYAQESTAQVHLG